MRDAEPRDGADRAPEPTDRAPSGHVEHRSRHSDSGSRRTDSSAGVFHSDESSRTSEQARGPPKLGRTRGANDSSGEGVSPWPERADGPPSRRLPTPRGRTRRGGSGLPAEPTESRAEPAALRPQERSRAASRHPPA